MKYLLIIIPCRSLAAGEQFLCDEQNQPPYPETTCIEQLLKFEENPTHCEQQHINIEEVRVQRITSTSWILFSKYRKTLTKSCNGDVSKYPVVGTYIMTLDEPCNVDIENIKIRRHHDITETDPVEPAEILVLPQLPMNINGTPKLSQERVLDMRGINLDEVKFMSSVLKQSVYSESERNHSGSEILGYSFCISVLLLVISVFLLLYIFRNKILKLKCCRNHRVVINKQTDNFELREGGVMSPSVLG